MSRLGGFGPMITPPPLGPILRAALGAGLGLAVTGTLLWLISGTGAVIDHPMIIAPFAASAVLIFAVPTSPLAQPWTVVLGNSIAAACGLVVLAIIPHPLPGVALAEFLAILCMWHARALHPPAGGVAAYAVLAVPPGSAPDWMFLLTPVFLGSVFLVGFGLIWHRLTGGAYPIVPRPSPPQPAPPPRA